MSPQPDSPFALSLFLVLLTGPFMLWKEKREGRMPRTWWEFAKLGAAFQPLLSRFPPLAWHHRRVRQLHRAPAAAAEDPVARRQHGGLRGGHGGLRGGGRGRWSGQRRELRACSHDPLRRQGGRADAEVKLRKQRTSKNTKADCDRRIIKWRHEMMIMFVVSWSAGSKRK